jgi:hypothetical protein
VSRNGNGNGNANGNGGGGGQKATAGALADAQPFLAQAGEALSRGDWAAAEEAFARGVAIAPGDARLHGGLALVAIQAGDWSRAVAHGQSAVALGGGSVELHNNLAWALEHAGRTEEAQRAYADAFVADPTRPEPVWHLLRHGIVPRLPDEPEGAPEPLETLDRLELYEHLGEALRAGDKGESWHGSWVWAMERGAPWGRLVAWLSQQGARNDRGVLEALAPRDEHLSDSVLAGMLIAPVAAVRKALGGVPGVSLVTPFETIPGGTVLAIAIDSTEQARVELPPQRTDARAVLRILTEALLGLGADSSVVLALDPAAHLGPRRLWMLSPVAGAEVVGTWQALDSEGNPGPPGLVPRDLMVAADKVALPLPGIDERSLEAVVREAGMEDAVRVRPQGQGLLVDADGVGRRGADWLKLLARLSRWIPEGRPILSLWREGGVLRLAMLQRNKEPRRFHLEPLWPPEQDQLDLPVETEVQLLGRALFQAPPSGSLMGVRKKGA